jgi:DNA-binding LacI/PurR family transcriptional regulator
MKYIQAQREIVTMIARNGMMVGDKLPEENSLSKILGVSAITTRRALKELSALGIVERKQGSGTFVKKELVKKKLSGTLGILLISNSDFNTRDVNCNNNLITKIQKECSKYGYDLKGISLGKDSFEIADKALAGLSGVFISGFINDDWIAYLKSINLPFVVLGESLADTPVTRVGFDWETAIEILISELISGGAKKIAFLNGSKSYTPSMKCYKGYQETLLKYHLPFNESWATWCAKKDYDEKIEEFFTHNADTQFDAIIAEEGVFPHLLSFMYNKNSFQNTPIGILGNNRGTFKGKNFISVGFSGLISKRSVKELMLKLNKPDSKNKTILLKPNLIEEAK